MIRTTDVGDFVWRGRNWRPSSSHHWTPCVSPPPPTSQVEPTTPASPKIQRDVGQRTIEAVKTQVQFLLRECSQQES